MDPILYPDLDRLNAAIADLDRAKAVLGDVLAAAQLAREAPAKATEAPRLEFPPSPSADEIAIALVSTVRDSTRYRTYVSTTDLCAAIKRAGNELSSAFSLRLLAEQLMHGSITARKVGRLARAYAWYRTPIGAIAGEQMGTSTYYRHVEPDAIGDTRSFAEVAVAGVAECLRVHRAAEMFAGEIVKLIDQATRTREPGPILDLARAISPDGPVGTGSLGTALYYVPGIPTAAGTLRCSRSAYAKFWVEPPTA